MSVFLPMRELPAARMFDRSRARRDPTQTIRNAMTRDDHMMAPASLPMPPLELRSMVGSPDLEFFDNPTGKMLYPDLSPAAYDTVFDFGCGCGRIARLLLMQEAHQPRRYVGIDVHRGMLGWCIQNLTPIAPHFQFVHHDVWSPGYGRGNSPNLAEPFPVEDGAFTLFIANSVFTHLYQQQAEYYLHETRRILAPNGIAVTSWFFFDNDSFPFIRSGITTLFVSETDPTAAVIYDRQWFLSTIRNCGLAVRRTWHPPVAGHQWTIELERRTPTSMDQFPQGDEDAEWLCGATRRPIAVPVMSQEEFDKHKVALMSPPGDTEELTVHRAPLPLTGPMAELAAAEAELAMLKGSVGMRVAARIVESGRKIKKSLGME